MSDLSSFAVDEGGPSAAGPKAAGGQGGRKRSAGQAGLDGQAATEPNKSAKASAPLETFDRAKAQAELQAYQALESRKTILKIKAWASAFPELLGEMLKDMDLEKLDLSRLESLLQQMMFTVATRTTGIVTFTGAESVLTVAEDVIDSHTSFHVKGPVAKLSNLSNDKNFQDLIKETTLYYADWVYSTPEKRLILYLMHQVMGIHKINSDIKDRIAENDKVAAEKGAEEALERSRRLREQNQ